MKRLSNLLAALVFASLIIFMSCGGDDGGDPELTVAQQAAIDIADGQWNVNAAGVTFDGAVSDFDWTGFNVNFNLSSEGATSGSYSSNISSVTVNDGSATQEADPIWAASGGSWSVSDDGSTLTKDGIQVTINVLSATNLTVSFTVASSARTAGVFDAVWSFPFTKAP
ncbi:MAG: hypothetical protein AAF616_03185 [Bacteroidota bacterium]